VNALPHPKVWQSWFQDALALPGSLDEALRATGGPAGLPAAAPELGRVLAPSATLRPEERLAIYRDMYWRRLVEALEQDFAGVRAVLGAEVFTDLARRYVGEHPSTTFTLNLYGAGFPDWLAARSEASRPREAFAADLARLEWARIEVFHAPRAVPLPPGRLEEVAPEAWPTARLRLVPGHRLLAARHPVGPWYRAFLQEEQTPEIPAAGDCRILLCRQGTVVRILDLETSAAALLTSLADGHPLADALAEAVAAAGQEGLGDRLGTWFQEWSACGLFQAVETSDQP